MITPIAGGLEQQDHGAWTGPCLYAESAIGNVDRELATVAGRVAEARRIVARQRANVLELRMLGKATPDHELTLQALVSTFAEMEGHARSLAEAAKRLERPRRLLS